MSSPHAPKQNRLLAALPAEDYARLLSNLELMAMPLGWTVYEVRSLRCEIGAPFDTLSNMLHADV